jgi:hypothetical protein
MPEEARRARRGPKPNPSRGTPTGYRIADRTRFELQVAAAFVGARSLQETVDIAVAEFLERQHQVAGFKDALTAAEANQRARGGIPTVGSPEE